MPINLHKNKYTIDEVVQYITKKDDVSNMTIERKMGLLMAYIVVTLEELERAKEPQKPLTLDELLSFDGTDFDGIKPVWCEDATGYENSGWILFDCKQKRVFNPFKNEWHAFTDEYEKAVGKAGCWRPWLRKPTDEERSAAAWEN